MVALCEEQGFIPRYYTDGPQDHIDKIILDMQHYLRDLVVDELGLSNLIENAVTDIQKEKEAIAEAGLQTEEEVEAEAEKRLFNYGDTPEDQVTAEDIAEYSDYVQSQEDEDFILYETEADD